MKKLISVLLSLVIILSCFVSAYAEQEKLHYLVLGDSIGVGSGIVNPSEACYGKIVANTNGYIYSNFAIDGFTTSNLLNWIDDQQVSDTIKSADIINISIGGNNFIKNNLPWLLLTVTFGNMSVINKIVEGVNRDLHEIITKIKAKNSDAVIILQTLYNPWKIKGIAGLYQKGVDALNACFRDYLKENPGAYELADVCSAFAAEKNLIAIDTIHPNAKGNILIAKVILKKLSELGLGTKTEPVILAQPIDRVSKDPSNYLRMFGFFTGIFL